MILWLIIALVVFAISLFVAFRSMRSVVRDEAKIFSEHLPPQPPLRTGKSTHAPEPLQAKSASAHTLQEDKNARASRHANEQREELPAKEIAESLIRQQPQTDALRPAPVSQAPQSVEEARQRLQDAIRRANVANTTIPKDNQTGHQQIAKKDKPGAVQEKRYLGEYKGSIVIQK